MSASAVLKTGPEGACRVTLVHGFLGAPRSWESVLHFLPDSLTVKAAIVPGHGDRPDLSCRSFDEAAARMAEAILPPSDGAPEILVGYSLGARLSLAMALAFPLRWKHVVVIGAHPGFADEGERSARIEGDRALARGLEQDGLEAFVDRWQALPLFETQATLSPRALAAQRSSRLSHTAQGIAWALDVLGTGRMKNLRVDLSRAPFSITWCAGSRDPKFLALAGEGARLSALGDLAVFDGVGHNVALEAPGRLARLIADRAARAMPTIPTDSRAPTRSEPPASAKTKHQE